MRIQVMFLIVLTFSGSLFPGGLCSRPKVFPSDSLADLFKGNEICAAPAGWRGSGSSVSTSILDERVHFEADKVRDAFTAGHNEHGQCLGMQSDGDAMAALSWSEATYLQVLRGQDDDAFDMVVALAFGRNISGVWHGCAIAQNAVMAILEGPDGLDKERLYVALGLNNL